MSTFKFIESAYALDGNVYLSPKTHKEMMSFIDNYIQIYAILDTLKECENCKHYTDFALCGCCVDLGCKLNEERIQGKDYCEKWEIEYE